MPVLLVVAWLWIALVIGLMLANICLALDWRRWADRCFGVGGCGMFIGTIFHDAFIPWSTPVQLAAFISFALSVVLLATGAILNEVAHWRVVRTWKVRRS